MKEKYEVLHVIVITAWLVTRDTKGFLIIFPFLAVLSLAAHIVITQKYYLESENRIKSATWVRVFHYCTLIFIYLCICVHFIWELVNVI